MFNNNFKAMKVITTVPVTLQNDREGILVGHVEIDITQESKDDKNKIYNFKTVDSVIQNPDSENETSSVLNNRHGEPQIKYYSKTYEEYDQMKIQLLAAYPTDLTGSELDDYLLQKGLLYNLIIDPIYVDGNQWRGR